MGDSARKKGAQGRVGSFGLGDGEGSGSRRTLLARVHPWPLMTVLSESQSRRGCLHPGPPSLRGRIVAGSRTAVPH